MLFNLSNLKLSSKHREGRFLSLFHKLFHSCTIKADKGNIFHSLCLYSSRSFFFFLWRKHKRTFNTSKSSHEAAQETLVQTAVLAQLYLFKKFSVELAAGQEIIFLWKTNDQNEKESQFFN